MLNIEYIEIEVPCMLHAVQYYQQSFCMRLVAEYEGIDKKACMLQRGDIKLILCEKTIAEDDPPELNHVVTEIAFLTHELDATFQRAIVHGQKALVNPCQYAFGEESIRFAKVLGVGNIRHALIQRNRSDSKSLPHFNWLESECVEESKLDLKALDHLAVCVYEADLEFCVKTYESIYGLKQTSEEYVATENSGMNSKVLQSQNGLVKLVFVAPVPGKKQSQVLDYLIHHQGPCVQHVAFSTQSIANTVHQLRAQGVEFLSIPARYYELQKQNSSLDPKLFDQLRELSILVDGQSTGQLYQIFTKPSKGKPSLFFEIIQRDDCEGFGSNNIKALFQAIEEVQIEHEAS